MADTRLVRINRTLYVRIPADEARRLNLREGQAVQVEVRPMGTTVGEAMRTLRGKYKGSLRALDRSEMWDL